MKLRPGRSDCHEKKTVVAIGLITISPDTEYRSRCPVRVQMKDNWFPNLVPFLSPLVAGIVAAVVTSFLGAYASFARFRREQWCQAKREAYEEIIKELSKIWFAAHREIQKTESDGQIVTPSGPARDEHLGWVLQDTLSGGAYVVSEGTVSAVSKVLHHFAMYSVEWNGNAYDSANKEYDGPCCCNHRRRRSRVGTQPYC